MTRARTRIPLLPHFNLGNRQRRTHRFLDEVREVLGRGVLAPIDDGAFPHATGVSGTFAPAVAQPVTLTGTHFLQDGVQAVGATDAATPNADVDWTVITPGIAGNLMTLSIVDGGGGAPTVVTTPTATSVVVTLDVAGGVVANLVIAAIAAHATARTMLIGVAFGLGTVNVTAQVATFSGGIGEGDYGVEIAGVAQTVLDWSATSISALLDLSAFASGSLVEILIIADGIEYRLNALCTAGGSPAGGGRVGTGFLLGAPGGAPAVLVDLDTFVVGTAFRVWDNTGPAPAPAPGFTDIPVTVAGPLDLNVTEIIAGVNADPTRLVDAAPVGAAGAATGVGFVPHSPAGNYVVVNGTTNWLWSGAGAAMEDGVATPLTLVPFQHTITANEAADLADDGVAGMFNLQMLDPGGAIGIVATDIVSGFMAV
jgi:hypothetical protein